MTTEELLFDSTPGFGSFYKKYLSHAIAHPAKMNTKLTEFLILKFTEKGDVVLDPMAGSGQTGVIAAVHGRDAVCVDLEQKFYKWMEQARHKVERQQTLTRKGKIRNVCGDARQLSSLLTEADVVVTSPPYSESMGKKRKGYTTHPNLSRTRHMGADSRDDNIGNLRHGKVDAVITSPPYVGKEQNTKRSRGWGPWNLPKQKEGFKRETPKSEPYEYSETPDQIGNLNYGVDVIVTSPPYADAKKGGEADEDKMAERWDKTAKDRNWNTWGKTWKTEGRKRALKSLGSGYSESEENIGNLRFADCIVTSPPYEDAMSSKRHTMNTEKQRKIFREKRWATRYEADVVITSPPYADTCDRKGRKMDEVRGVRGRAFDLLENKENIGNLAKETYLQAMLTVYQQMFSVLKPTGKAIIIIKPFIRNKKVVDLPYQTWLLLKRAGFKLTRLFKLRLKQQSFWRILYTKKHPEVPQIKHEYILICQKSPSFSVK